jgi:hypothetical protein
MIIPTRGRLLLSYLKGLFDVPISGESSFAFSVELPKSNCAELTMHALGIGGGTLPPCAYTTELITENNRATITTKKMVGDILFL